MNAEREAAPHFPLRVLDQREVQLLELVPALRAEGEDDRGEVERAVEGVVVVAAGVTRVAHAEEVLDERVVDGLAFECDDEGAEELEAGVLDPFAVVLGELFVELDELRADGCWADFGDVWEDGDCFTSDAPDGVSAEFLVGEEELWLEHLGGDNFADVFHLLDCVHADLVDYVVWEWDQLADEDFLNVLLVDLGCEMSHERDSEGSWLVFVRVVG